MKIDIRKPLSLRKKVATCFPHATGAGIYRIKHKRSGKCYVGFSKDIGIRLYAHFKDLSARNKKKRQWFRHKMFCASPRRYEVAVLMPLREDADREFGLRWESYFMRAIDARLNRNTSFARI